MDKVLYCSAIDLIAVHGYMTAASQLAAYIPKLADQAASQGTKLFIEEWVGTGASYDNINKQAQAFSNAGVPSLSISPHGFVLLHLDMEAYFNNH